MIVTDKHAEARELLDAHRAAGRTVGVVGTSGGTHAGHLSLAQAARRECDVLAVFWTGAFHASFARGIAQHYDRDPQADAKLFEEAGADLLFVTKADDFYQRPAVTRVELPDIAVHLAGMPEGEHMTVIVTTVLTLLNIAGACTMVFGEKDWPQLVMFQRMARDLMLPSRIVASPTVRESDGLAISSRNVRLSLAGRRAAPELHRALAAGAAAIEGGERDAAVITGAIRERLARVSVPDYVTAVEADTLRPLEVLRGQVRLLASATFDGTPLVDNVGVAIATAGRR